MDLEEREVSFEEFLDDSFDTELEQDEIITETEANYYIGRVKRNEDRKAAVKNRAKTILEDYKIRVSLWEEKQVKAIDYDVEKCMEKLERYFAATSANKSSKLSFPEGRLGYYKQRGSVKIDKEIAGEFVKLNKNDSLNSYIKTEYSVDFDTLKKDAQVNYDNLTFSVNGVVIPGVTVTAPSEKFSIRK